MEKVYKLSQIARRKPPGDRWELQIGGEKIEGLTKTLNDYFKKTKIKGPFLLDPEQGLLYLATEEVPKIQEPERFDLYGENE